MAVEISQELRKSSESLYNMIENLLDWSNLERRAAEYSPGNIFPEKIVSDNVELFRSTAKQKGIEIVNNCESCGPVYADRQMLDSVIRNLLSNALKFTPPGGSITLSTKKEEEMVSVIVRDTGPGMKEDLINRILNAGTVESTRGTGNEKGSGLGLSLCREFIEVNQGSFSLRNAAPGGGTEAEFGLPAAK
jgi:signal transduction histidine kinase